jgi:hypothetical protein
MDNLGLRVKPAFEEWVGDDQDGCYVKVFECEDGTWRNEVIVDSETGSFVDTLDECDGFATHEEAMESGKSLAFDWCVENQVPMDVVEP